VVYATERGVKGIVVEGDRPCGRTGEGLRSGEALKCSVPPSHNTEKDVTHPGNAHSERGVGRATVSRDKKRSASKKTPGSEIGCQRINQRERERGDYYNTSADGKAQSLTSAHSRGNRSKCRKKGKKSGEGLALIRNLYSCIQNTNTARRG